MDVPPVPVGLDVSLVLALLTDPPAADCRGVTTDFAVVDVTALPVRTVALAEDAVGFVSVDSRLMGGITCGFEERNECPQSLLEATCR
jgi:hypothetical protein